MITVAGQRQGCDTFGQPPPVQLLVGAPVLRRVRPYGNGHVSLPAQVPDESGDPCACLISSCGRHVAREDGERRKPSLGRWLSLSSRCLTDVPGLQLPHGRGPRAPPFQKVVEPIRRKADFLCHTPYGAGLNARSQELAQPPDGNGGFIHDPSLGQTRGSPGAAQDAQLYCAQVAQKEMDYTWELTGRRTGLASRCVSGHFHGQPEATPLPYARLLPLLLALTLGHATVISTCQVQCAKESFFLPSSC